MGGGGGDREAARLLAAGGALRLGSICPTLLCLSFRKKENKSKNEERFIISLSIF